MIGTLRNRVEILKPQRVPDGGGGYSIQYTSLGSVSANVSSRSSVKDRAMGDYKYRRKRRFLVRQRDDLIFEMRLLFNGSQYRITDIQDENADDQTTLIEAEEILV